MPSPTVTGADLAAGQVLIGGTEGTSLTERTTARLVSGRLGGLILMGRNIEDAPQVAAMLAQARTAAAPGEPPPLLGVDQEGGRVARLRRDVIQLPPARDQPAELLAIACDQGANRVHGRHIVSLCLICRHPKPPSALRRSPVPRDFSLERPTRGRYCHSCPQSRSWRPWSSSRIPGREGAVRTHRWGRAAACQTRDMGGPGRPCVLGLIREVVR